MSLGAMDGATSALLADIVIGFNKFVIVYFALINLGYLSIFLLSLRSLWRFVRLWKLRLASGQGNVPT